MLLKKDPNSPETVKELKKWVIARENEAIAAKTPTAAIKVISRRARLYFAADMFEDAYEFFIHARLQAHNEGLDGLRAEIEAEMDEKEL